MGRIKKRKGNLRRLVVWPISFTHEKGKGKLGKGERKEGEIWWREREKEEREEEDGYHLKSIFFLLSFIFFPLQSTCCSLCFCFSFFFLCNLHAMIQENKVKLFSSSSIYFFFKYRPIQPIF